MYVRRPATGVPRRHEWEGESGWEIAHLLSGTGLANSDQEDVLTEAERRAERKRVKEALARKRPVGFAPWPSDDE